MNFSPRSSSPTNTTSQFHHGQVWDTSMEMIASSMMLVTITEEQTTHVGYQTRRTPSGNSMGSALSRKSVKTNLSLLGTSDCSMDVSSDDEDVNNNYYSAASTASNQETDEWGFFIDSP